VKVAPDAQRRTDASRAVERPERRPKSGRATNGATHVAADVLALAEQVILSERLDAHLLEWQRRGQMGFFLPAGEWAGALAGVCAATEGDDWLFPGLREARVCVHRGMPLTSYLAQHLGLGPTGVSPEETTAGRSQAGAVCDAAHRVASPPSGVANHLVHAVGAAMAATKLKTRGSALAICGQVGLDSSDFHVAANFAGVFKAPVLIIVRAEAGPDAPGSVASLAERATAYGLEHAIAASEDALVVRDAVKSELAKVRAGRPGLLVLEAPRRSEGMRPRWLQELGDTQIAALEHDADVALEQAFAAARDGVRPAVASLTRGVFAQEPRALVDQRRDLSGEQPISPDEV
jgi:TPP-dependent pyruvate/acetoin dehydrogenase alpha subunit